MGDGQSGFLSQMLMVPQKVAAAQGLEPRLV